MSDPAPNPTEQLRVLVVGGGVAAIETILALHDLAAERVGVRVLAPNNEFVYRPMTVREPFAYAKARRYELAPIVQHAGAELIEGELAGSTGTPRSSTRPTGASSPTTPSCWPSGRGSPRATATA